MFGAGDHAASAFKQTLRRPRTFGIPDIQIAVLYLHTFVYVIQSNLHHNRVQSCPTRLITVAGGNFTLQPSKKSLLNKYVFPSIFIYWILILLSSGIFGYVNGDKQLYIYFWLYVLRKLERLAYSFNFLKQWTIRVHVIYMLVFYTYKQTIGLQDLDLDYVSIYNKTLVWLWRSFQQFSTANFHLANIPQHSRLLSSLLYSRFPYHCCLLFSQTLIRYTSVSDAPCLLSWCFTFSLIADYNRWEVFL